MCEVQAEQVGKTSLVRGGGCSMSGRQGGDDIVY